MNRRAPLRSPLVVLALLAVTTAAAAPPAARAATVVYANDFEKNDVGKEWSATATEATPRGDRRFLGPHRADAVTLALEKLPRHAFVRVSLDLYVISTWDGNVSHSKGNGAVIGPDAWRMRVLDEPAAGAAAMRPGMTLVDATFSNYDPGSDPDRPDGRPQSYPSILRGVSNPARTGAAERDTLGFERVSRGVGTAMDSVYRLSFVIPHDADRVRFEFQGVGEINPTDDERWGLDNVKVEALDAADVPKRDVDYMRRLWEAVGGRDPVAEADAYWKLVAATDDAARFLRDRVKPAAGPDRKAFRALLRGLDGETFTEREQATEAIRSLGPAAEPLIREAIDRGPSAEGKLRLESALKSLAESPPEDPEAKRHAIALRLLKTIGTPAALKAADALIGK